MRVCLVLLVASLAVSGEAHASCPAPGPTYPECLVRGWTGESLYSIGPGLGFEWNPGAMGISLELPLPLRYRQDREGFRFDSFLPVPNVSIVYYLPGGR